MTTNCPLPIEWLEFLESDDNPGLKQHLATCASCQETIRRLESVKGNSLVVSTTPKPQFSRVADIEGPIQKGDVWLSAGSFEGRHYRYGGVDQLLLVVLRSVDEAGGGHWLDVVPAFSDTENATPTDFNLLEGDTTMSWPLRLDFAMQTTIDASQLATRIGRLTDAGQTALQHAVQGDVDTRRTGPPLEGEDDPRLIARQHYAEVIRTISGPRTRLIEAPDESKQAAWSQGALWFSVVTSQSAGRYGALAAAGESSPRRYDVVPSTQIPGVELSGWELRYDPLTDSISLSLQKAVGLTHPARAVLYAADRKAFTSRSFIPESGTDFELASGWGVHPQKITGIELRIE
jgi:hypothetical protein